jgi:hypothetical protein
VSAKLPQSYVLHTTGIAILMIIAIIFFLRTQWCH